MPVTPGMFKMTLINHGMCFIIPRIFICSRMAAIDLSPPRVRTWPKSRLKPTMPITSYASHSIPCVTSKGLPPVDENTSRRSEMAFWIAASYFSIARSYVSLPGPILPHHPRGLTFEVESSVPPPLSPLMVLDIPRLGQANVVGSPVGMLVEIILRALNNGGDGRGSNYR